MIQRKSTFFIGIFILLISSSFLAVPSVWKTGLLFLSGIALIIISVKFTLPKKPLKRPLKKGKPNPMLVDTIIPAQPLNTEKKPVGGDIANEKK